MIKFFFIILQISLVILVVSFLINNSFIISLEIKDLTYSINSSYLSIVIFFILLIIFFLQSFYFKTKFLVSKFKILSTIKQKEKGYNSFVNGMIALANKDYKKAIQESKKVSNYLDAEKSLSLLLKSEVYKLENKFTELNQVFEEMIKNENTKNLGYRGLMELYLRSQDYHHAFIYGEKLFNNNPNIEKIYDTLVNIIAKTNNWQQLINLSDKAYSNKVIDKKYFNENKSIGFYEIAKIKQISEPKEAISFIEKSLNLRKNFPPYVKFYLDILIQEKKYFVAKRYIKKVWTQSPHADYKDSIFLLAKSLKISHLEIVTYITNSSINLEASKILLVEASINDQKWDAARKNIVDLIDTVPSKEICLLMAKIEKGDTNDIQKINSWTLRSRNGDLNNLWVCTVTNKSQNQWSSLSDAGHFNSLEWRKPTMLNISTF